jgi:hypothetical protein
MNIFKHIREKLSYNSSKELLGRTLLGASILLIWCVSFVTKKYDKINSKAVENKFELMALEYLVENQELNSSIKELCLDFPDTFFVTKPTYLFGVYLCNKDEELYDVYQRELTLEITPKATNKIIPFNSIDKVCNQSNRRTVKLLGARDYGNKVYVEVRLVSNNKTYGEAMFVVFEKKTDNVTNYCISSWAS